jgi:hypothetical protein
LRSGGVLVVRVPAIERSAFGCERVYARSEKYAVMMTTSKSIAPIARRKKPKDGSGMKALPLLLAFAMDFELQVDGLVPNQPRRKSQKSWERSPLFGVLA